MKRLQAIFCRSAADKGIGGKDESWTLADRGLETCQLPLPEGLSKAGSDYVLSLEQAYGRQPEHTDRSPRLSAGGTHAIVRELTKLMTERNVHKPAIIEKH